MNDAERIKREINNLLEKHDAFLDAYAIGPRCFLWIDAGDGSRTSIDFLAPNATEEDHE